MAAWGVVAVGAAVPLARRRARIPPPLVTATAAAAPLALCVAVPRSVALGADSFDKNSGRRSGFDFEKLATASTFAAAGGAAAP